MRYILQILLFTNFCLYSQSKEAVVTKVSAQYALNKPLHFNTVYNLYKTPESKSIIESYKGEFYKNAANEIYLKINATEYFITKKVSAQISHSEKIVLVSKTKTIPNDQYDIDKLLKSFDYGSFKDKKTHWEIELLAKKVTDVPYSKIILYIGKDYFIQKQVFYYRTGINFSKDYSKKDIQLPKLEIAFSKPSRKEIASSIFDTSPYFSVTKKEIKLSGKCSNYELIDQR